MGSSKWILGLHLKRPFRFFYVLIAPIIEIFLYLYPVTVTANIISSIFEGTLQNLSQQLLYLLGFALFQSLVYYSINFINETLAHRVTTDMTEDLFVSVQKKSLTYHDSIDIGQIMSRATGDTRTINKALSPGIVRVLQLFTIWMLAFYITSRVNLLLLGVSILFFLIYITSLYFYGKNRIEISRQVLVNYADLTELSLRSVSGIREVKNFVAEGQTSDNFSKLNNNHIKSLTREGIANAWFYPALIATIYSTGIISIAIYFTYISIISFEELLLITGVILFLRTFSSNLKWQSRMIIAAIAANKRVYDIIHQPDLEEVIEGTLAMDDTRATIEFNEVSFRYKPNLPLVLDGINFSVDENSTIAIVGPPGSGKTTLTKLIQRLYLPTKGEIKIGGQKIENYTLNALRSFVSTVEQDVFLFNRSILDNIKFGRPESNIDDVVKVTKIAKVHEFIESLPEGYETKIGEKGVRLSGGQKQRIAIARAILMKPSVLLMDDGSSALDAKTELEIQTAISQILRTRTTVITTHRLSIIAQADIILILDKGRLIGKGKHSKLIRTNRHYRRLFEFHYELPPLELDKEQTEVASHD